jgi:hypothetical protein
MANLFDDSTNSVVVRGRVGLVLSLALIDWRTAYGMGTQMRRLQDERRILVDEVLQEN